jgi:flagellar assembly factor FliW
MLKNPFKSIKSRLNKVYLYLIIISTVLLILDYQEVNMFTGWIVINPYYFTPEKYQADLKWANLIGISICIVLSVIPAWLVLYRLFSKGTSENLKK